MATLPREEGQETPCGPRARKTGQVSLKYNMYNLKK